MCTMHRISLRQLFRFPSSSPWCGVFFVAASSSLSAPLRHPASNPDFALHQVSVWEASYARGFRPHQRCARASRKRQPSQWQCPRDVRRAGPGRRRCWRWWRSGCWRSRRGCGAVSSSTGWLVPHQWTVRGEILRACSIERLCFVSVLTTALLSWKRSRRAG